MKKKLAVFLNSFLIHGVFAAMSAMAPAQAASPSWGAQQLGPAITTGLPRAAQSFPAPPELALSSAAVTIRKVHVSYRHGGRAVLKSRLCLDGGGPCVDMNGAVLNTSAFAGQDARRGFVLQHEVWSWAGSTTPVRVQADIQVWYERAD